MTETFFVVFSTAGWIGSLLFIGIYHRSSRWWELGYGRALFILGSVIVSFFTTSMLYNLFGPDYPGRNAMRIINLSVTVPMIWYLLWVLVRGGAAARKKRRADAEQAADETKKFPENSL